MPLQLLKLTTARSKLPMGRLLLFKAKKTRVSPAQRSNQLIFPSTLLSRIVSGLATIMSTKNSSPLSTPSWPALRLRSQRTQGMCTRLNKTPSSSSTTMRTDPLSLRKRSVRLCVPRSASTVTHPAALVRALSKTTPKLRANFKTRQAHGVSRTTWAFSGSKHQLSRTHRTRRRP